MLESRGTASRQNLVVISPNKRLRCGWAMINFMEHQTIIIRLVRSGLSNKGIAPELDISKGHGQGVSTQHL